MDQNVIIIAEDKGQKPKILPEQCFPSRLIGSGEFLHNITNGVQIKKTRGRTQDPPRMISPGRLIGSGEFLHNITKGPKGN